ncbi:hypothetical protein BDN70DRAFT_72380 [Pholiota conissans]|uniref:Uncharacterized protein n=1 Tax=Pholiota conissans TaxID=109636 RepID=A0A9P5Z1I2_9AGAR|nr:hypothetical protein BDN70DRAFT_72380 [Pholiota conissans]
MPYLHHQLIPSFFFSSFAKPPVPRLPFIPCHSMHLSSTSSITVISYTPPFRTRTRHKDRHSSPSGIVAAAFVIKYILFFTLSYTCFTPLRQVLVDPHQNTFFGIHIL